MNRSPSNELVRFNMAAHRMGPKKKPLNSRLVTTASYPFLKPKPK